MTANHQQILEAAEWVGFDPSRLEQLAGFLTILRMIIVRDEALELAKSQEQIAAKTTELLNSNRDVWINKPKP